jgi:hypothetical protein
MTNANIGNNKSVTTDIQLTGTAANNYTLTQPGYVTVNITAKAGVSISYDQLQDHAPQITGPTIRIIGAGTDTITVTNPGDYTSIRWRYNGAYITGGDVGGTNNSVLTVTNSRFNKIGEHLVTVEVVKDGRQYSKVVTVTVTP